jgi:hypothetical protein
MSVAPESERAAAPARRRRRVLGRVLAWTVTLGALGWLFWKTPVTEVWAAIGQAAPWFVPATVAAVLLIYLGDTLAIWKTFAWFLAKLSLREVLVVRGASYLLAIINYSVGQGAIVYFVHRARGVPVVQGAATVLFIMGINVIVLLVLVTVGLVVGGSGERPPALAAVAGVAWAGLAVYAVVVAAKPRFLEARSVFAVLLSAGFGGHLKAMAVRLPHVGSLVVFNLVFLYAFGVKVPLGAALFTLPVVIFIAALPISVQGLGTTQAAMVLFFARYVTPGPLEPAAVVTAASLAAQGIAVACQAALGLVCMRSREARGLGEGAKHLDDDQGPKSR